MKRKICVITGTRADYGIYFPVLQAIKQSPKLSLFLVATGMHLMPEFGSTYREIERDGFKINAKVRVVFQNDDGGSMADAVGAAIQKFVKVFSRLKPDIVMVLGDRGEMLAAAIAANYLNLPVAHIHGGEISGHVDGIVRHAISKLSHIHLPATKTAGQRLARLGEAKSNIFVSGAPALDRIIGEQATGRAQLIRKYDIDQRFPLALVVQHPVNTGIDQAAKQMKATIQAVEALGLQTIIIYPNADAGGRAMIREIKKWKKLANLKTYASVPHRDYLGLMKMARVLIGNSSSGLIEAPSFRLPVVNIGSRQRGRERGQNVIDVHPEKNAIIRAVKKSLNEKKYLNRVKQSKNPYGDGHASRRIVRVLSSIKLGPKLTQKQITY